jgi:succinate dehydrogenase / fumarate reductase cytochrome b subunit
MSAVAINSTFARGVFFYRTTVGKKVVMALTGIVLFGFVLGHMAGNLQYFLGRDVLNAYAEKLHHNAGLLWAVRLSLLTAVALHIVSAFQLWTLQRAARPVAYVKKDNVGSTIASRTMYFGGATIAFFVVYHILHLTTGTVHPDFDRNLDAYSNVVIGFQRWPVSLFYILAVGMLGLHIYHGVWSLFQTLGFSHPRYTPKLKLAAKFFAVIIVLGFISVPIAVLAGYHPDFNRV